MRSKQPRGKSTSAFSPFSPNLTAGVTRPPRGSLSKIRQIRQRTSECEAFLCMGPPVKFGEFVEHARDAVSFCFIIAQGRSPPRGDIGPSYAGTVTTLGSSAFRKFIPDQDYEIVVRLKQAGLVIFGRTHTPEFGLSSSSESRLFGATHKSLEPRVQRRRLERR